jgi:chromatin remodeling complex protein RSC6
MPPKKKPSTTKAKKAAPKKAGAKRKAPTAKRATPAAFKKKFKPDALLSAVVGSTADTRGQFMKKIWDYIKKHNLQDKNDGRLIHADAKLRPLFGAEKISMLKLGGIVSKHIHE